jgi:hypothetical protein
MTPTAKKILIGGGVLLVVAAVLNFVVFAEKSTPPTARGVQAAQ